MSKTLQPSNLTYSLPQALGALPLKTGSIMKKAVDRSDVNISIDWFEDGKNQANFSISWLVRSSLQLLLRSSALADRHHYLLDLLSGWRDEEYAIYGPRVLQAASDSNEIINPGLPGSNIAFRLERAATGLFGFLTFGVHLTGWSVSWLFAGHLHKAYSSSLSTSAYIIKDGAYHIWVPRRSPTKPTSVPPPSPRFRSGGCEESTHLILSFAHCSTGGPQC